MKQDAAIFKNGKFKGQRPLNFREIRILMSSASKTDLFFNYSLLMVKILLLPISSSLGLVSYCLEIYYQRTKAFNARMLTALTNRVGDVILLMAVV